MRIGDLKLKNPYLLAPMHQINDIAFRILCKKNGCSLAYTWLLNPLTRAELILDDCPAVQLACPSEKGIREFIKKYEKNASLFDFNLGCPAVRAKEQDYGAFLQKHPAKVEKILKTMRSSTSIPITVKVRKSPHVPKLIKIFNKHCDAIAIHPRTIEQGYSGTPDISFAEKMKSLTDLPVIYSGDVDENNAPLFLEKFEFVMIGRKAIGNPAIFSKLTKTKAKGSFSDYLKLAEKYHLDFTDVKFQALNFTKGHKNARRMRLDISKTKGFYDLKALHI